MSKSPYDIVLHPLFTEKSTMLKEVENKIAFVVQKDANKVEIKRAIEKLFSVEVKSVNTQIIRGKVKRTGKTSGKLANWKKAVVTLHGEGTIDLFESN